MRGAAKSAKRAQDIRLDQLLVEGYILLLKDVEDVLEILRLAISGGKLPNQSMKGIGEVNENSSSRDALGIQRSTESSKSQGGEGDQKKKGISKI